MTRLERIATFLVLRALHVLNSVQGTSPNTTTENEPHQTACRPWEKSRGSGWNRNMNHTHPAQDAHKPV